MDQHQTKQTKGFDQEAFASILNRIIKKRGIRKQDFAIEAGIRNTSLSRYLTGKLLQPPHFSNLERIAAASGDPEHIFPELLDATGYTLKDYEDYKKRSEQKLEARRDVEDAVWDTCGRLLHMKEQDLKQAFGCTSVRAVMQKYRYQEAVSILYNNYANSRHRTGRQRRNPGWKQQMGRDHILEGRNLPDSHGRRKNNRDPGR